MGGYLYYIWIFYLLTNSLSILQRLEKLAGKVLSEHYLSKWLRSLVHFLMFFNVFLHSLYQLKRLLANNRLMGIFNQVRGKLANVLFPFARQEIGRKSFLHLHKRLKSGSF